MRRAVLTGALVALTACSTGEPDLLNFRAREAGPDEFAVLPTRPLTLEGLPANTASLPSPTPGAANLTDPTPEIDAIVALGGSAGAATRPADGGIVNYVARNGIDPNIRAELAEDDRRYRSRRRGRLLERIFGVTTYYGAYESQSLDQYRELDRFRGAGVRTPAATPEGVELPGTPTAIDGPSFYDPSPAVSGG